MFQLDGIRKNLKKITRAYGSCGEEKFELLRSDLTQLDCDDDLFCGNEKLINLLTRIWTASAEISEQISLQFFSYTGTRLNRKQAK